ncbi:BCCT family transporter [Thalassotalea agarivorans]|uniref:Betaine/carnitine transporter, BCCT family n=1 Tax=Thalassotalea agarivorans TaxID=349064 RepID=A0A1I0DNH3_THASX|nr:BCCT family transporter [Thalassotalea agarivorans]SET33894.1 betaine/carnitine transporter, BCCT family [Thalassotalea agarivorans]
MIKNLSQLDRPMFLTTIGVILLVTLPIFIFRETAGPVITNLFNSLTNKFGWLYQWYAVLALGFLLWLAFSRYGAIKLSSKDTDTPDYSTLTWITMIFCAGVGAGLLYWAVIEWSYYLKTPPMGLDPESAKAKEWAATYPLFHWGVSAWAIYCLPAIAIAYPFYKRQVPFLRLSTSCGYFYTEQQAKQAGGTKGRIIDFLYMLSLIGGAGTSLGLSTPMIAANIAELLGVHHDIILEISVVLLCVAIFGTSAYLGLDRGFKSLSEFNLIITFALLFFVLAVGPTLFILKTGTNSIGIMVQNFFAMSFWTDPIDKGSFVENWTVFYWAWWVAYGPFVGLFVTRISRGRTIKQLILGMLCFGSLGAWLFFVVFGNYALNLQLSGMLDINTIIAQAGEATAITQILLALPFGKFAVFLFAVVSIVFLVTTYDSASYTLASVTTKSLREGENPQRWNRLFWACALGVVPIALMSVDGGIKVILSTTIVVSLPLLIVGALMSYSLLKMIQQDNPKIKR